jgi:hypothetical protein
MIAINRTFITCALLLIALVSSVVDARTRDLTDADIAEGWRLLDCGQRYKEVWVNDREQQGLPKTYSELLDSLDAEPAGVDCTNTVMENGFSRKLKHQEYIMAATQKFSHSITTKTGSALEQARWGLQESFGLISEARLVKGNDLLINGLRTRFKADPDAKSQIETLGDSVAELKTGLNETLPLLLANSAVVRTSGYDDDSFVSSTFPFMVMNTEGPVTNNEYMQFTELLNRYGMAATSEAKYFFYRDNIKDVDNPPFNNFPGIEDLDFNGDRVENEAGRIEASKRAKIAASNLYLQGVVLAAKQDPDTFQTNNGYQLKRQLNDADRLYLDIQNGFNPLKLAGDFVPYQRVENFLQLARARITDAAVAEQAARVSQRSYEVDQTALQSELQSQTLQYLNQLEELTGLSMADYDLQELITSEGRAKFRMDAHNYAEIEKKGQIGIMQLEVDAILLQAKMVQEQMNQVTYRVINEQERSGRVISLISKTGKKIGVLEFALSLQNACVVSIAGVASGTTCKLEIGATALAKKEITESQYDLQADQESINSFYLIKNMLLEEATLAISLEQIIRDLDRQKALIETQWNQLDRILANYAVSQENFADAYFSNPAYRMEASRAEQAAEESFETALELSYYAAKALEYQWSEKFNNPVLRLDGGLPEPLSASFDPFMRAESVFSSQFSTILNPSLDNYLDGLQAWDVKMRQLRYPERQTATVRFSLRNDLLDLGEFSSEVAEAKFRAMVNKSRYMGENTSNPDMKMEFTLDISDESLFPSHPNIKIETINANLVSTASRSVRGSNNMAPALMDVVLLDRAHVRTFFAEYPARDDMLSYQLQGGRSLEKSPFIATVEANVDGYASPAASANTQLANHSPAVSTWVLRFKNNRYNNRDIKFEYLADIEFEIQYSYGKPRDFQFSN